MATYQGISIPSIFEAQMPENENILLETAGKLIPTLARAWIYGMQRKETNQLRADTSLYSAYASSAQHYVEPDDIEGLIDSLTSMKDEQIALGDTVRSQYIDASIAAIKPYHTTRTQQKRAGILINEMEDSFRDLEGKPGYEKGALDLLDEWNDVLDEYEPYFSTRMVKDINEIESDMAYRISAEDILNTLDSEPNVDWVKPDGTKVKGVPGVQLKNDYPDEESKARAQVVVDFLERGTIPGATDKSSIKYGVSEYRKLLSDIGVANSATLAMNKLQTGEIATRLQNALDVIASYTRVPRGASPDLKLHKDILENIMHNPNVTVSVGEKNLSPERLKQIRNMVLGDLSHVLKNTTFPVKASNIKDMIKEWDKSGAVTGPSANAMLDVIYEGLAFWNEGSVLTETDYVGLNYPGTGGRNDNAIQLVKSYLDFLRMLEGDTEALYDMWGMRTTPQGGIRNSPQFLKYQKNKYGPTSP